jgi:ribosomal protein S18 acetylase RimI-like enzyme
VESLTAEPVTATAARNPGSPLVSTHSSYDRPVTPGADHDSADVTMRAMTDEEFRPWRTRVVADYIDDLTRETAASAEEARDSAERRLAEVLPDGPRSARTWLMAIVDDTGESVGTLWLAGNRDGSDEAYVYDIEIAESHRGRGLGRATMLAAERLARDAGCRAIGLSVFGTNAVARSLYDSLGYRVVSSRMTKPLDDLADDR